jgi:hypothetical protein
MAMKNRKTMLRGSLCAAALLAACGGGELLLLTIVTPLNGVWQDAGTTEFIQFVNPGANVYLTSSKFEVQGTLVNPVNACNGTLDVNGALPLEGTLDNGKVSFFAANTGRTSVCIEGTFTSMVRFAAAAGAGRPARNYENDRVGVDLQLGLWVSDGARVKLKFRDLNQIDNDAQGVQVDGCDVSPGVAPTNFTGFMNGFVTATGRKPTIDTLATAPGNTTLFTQVEFSDGGTLTLRDARNQPLTLHRQIETVATVCP